MERLKTIQARVPEKLYGEVEERIKTGLYTSKSEVIREALRKMFAEQSREFLRELIKQGKITEKEMLKELEKVREVA